MTADEMNLERNVPLSVADPVHERNLAIREADWKRIRREVANLEVGKNLIEHAPTWSATAAGSAVGIGVTALVLMSSESATEPWVIPVLWVAAVACVAFAICFGLIARDERKRHNLRVSDVCDAMDEVSAPFDEDIESRLSAEARTHRLGRLRGTSAVLRE